MTANAQLSRHVDELLTSHSKLLADAQRNRQFFRALKRCVTVDSVVLDLGTGTGLWAIAAAKLGARHVVAVERNSLMRRLIERLAAENGVAERIEIVIGEALQVSLAREFDVVISETIGSLIFDEPVVPLLLAARERFLKPGGVLLPSAVSLRAAPVWFAAERMPAGLETSFAAFESLSLHVPVALQKRDQVKFAGPSQTLVTADFATLAAPPALTNLSARWQLPHGTPVNGCVVWGEIQLGEDLRLSTFDSSNWTPVVYRFEPFDPIDGELEFKLALTPESNYWMATWITGQSKLTRSYSPVQAASELLA